jgi:hypothetical protein
MREHPETGAKGDPALIKPRDHCIAGSDHPNTNVFDLALGGSETYTKNLQQLVASPNQTQYNQHRTETWITKPLLILRLDPWHSLEVLYCMNSDIMHLALNLSALLVALWQVMIDCDNSNDINIWAIFVDNTAWVRYSASVYTTGPHLPGSFDIQ